VLPAQRPVVARQRLDHLDGLRGLASFYVVLFHAGVGFHKGALSTWARAASRLLVFGHEAVAIFIVLSGYCLTLPVVRAERQLPRGVGDYFARRAWRILPPYYAALLGSLALIALVPALREAGTGTIWDDTHPAFSAGSVLSHLALVHNLSPAWVNRINGPLWSVATEWQIYFFLPFVLLPVWRRGDLLGAVVAAFGLGYLPCFLWPRVAESAVTWYLGLFALGMAAAALTHGTGRSESALRRRIPWGAVTVALAGLCAVGGLVLATLWFQHKPYTDALVGLATASLLVHCGRHVLEPGATRPALLRLFERRPLVSLGHWSYSLYLTHLPVVALVYFGLRRLPLAPAAHVAAMLMVATPASLLVAYGFHLAVERRFLGGPPRRR
jgi:peptidoglycan/LPS O-acetylase OafA/YrhL